MVPATTAYKWWNCYDYLQIKLPAEESYKLLSTIFLQNSFSVVFLKVGQIAAAKLTHYSTKPHRPSDALRPRLCLLLSGDVQQNPGPTTKYPCSVYTHVTSRGVIYQCNNCKNWVHVKCSKLQSTNEYRQDKKWACSSCTCSTTKTSASTLYPHPKRWIVYNLTIQREWHRERCYGT